MFALPSSMMINAKPVGFLFPLKGWCCPCPVGLFFPLLLFCSMGLVWDKLLLVPNFFANTARSSSATAQFGALCIVSSIVAGRLMISSSLNFDLYHIAFFSATLAHVLLIPLTFDITVLKRVINVRKDSPCSCCIPQRSAFEVSILKNIE